MGFLYRGGLFVAMDIAQAKNSKIAEIESVRRQFKDSYLRLIRALKVIVWILPLSIGRCKVDGNHSGNRIATTECDNSDEWNRGSRKCVFI